MKIAVIHDYLCGLGGAERVFQYICEELREADAYALAFNPEKTYPYFRSRGIRTTWLNRYVQSMDAFRWSFPIATHAMESIDLTQYDIVLSSSATVAKYVNVPHGKHICYCYIPTRALWQFDEYFGRGAKTRFLRLFLPYLKRRDYAAAQRVDEFVAISNASRDYIRKDYNREAQVMYCPIDLERFAPLPNRKPHYLIVSRLEHWKRVDYAVEAFNILGLPLRIIGTGKDEARLKSLAKPNIDFLGPVDDVVLAREYAEARAVIFTPYLEYGLIPLEANASGTPVICYGRGGITETMVAWRSDQALERAPTAVFFYEQTPEALVEAVRRFDETAFNSEDLVRHASHWGVPAFKRKIRQLVDSIVNRAKT